MQFDSGSSRIVRHGIRSNATRMKLTLSQISSSERPAYSSNLQMYAVPPSEEISIEEFDDIAIERVKALKVVEDVKERYTWGSNEFKVAMTRELSKVMPIAAGTCMAVDVEQARRRDVIGHFILRLAFCRSPESTKWLVTQEVDLFRFRFLNESQTRILKFLKENDINLEVVDKSEQEELMADLAASCGLSIDQTIETDFWKVDFTSALELVRRRRVLVRRGYAYVPFDDLVVIVSAMLRANMTAAMARAFKHLAVVEEEGRLLPRLARLANNAYSGKQYAGKESDGKVTRHMIDQLCASSFPPCMRQIHHRLRGDHHLRHGARRQYGLFLKAIGLSLDEAMMFMREEFTKKIDSDKFEKQYAYNIRHMYGKEGRRVEYPAFPCSTIILSNPPAAGDCHGCPFKHLDHQLLAQRLEKDGLNRNQVNQIVNYSKASAYDKACTRFFEYSHKMDEGALGQLITHPNSYYELSQEVLSGARSKSTHIHQSHSLSQSSVKKEENFSDTEE
ncbi:Eukaryotic-type DNA primase, large subunit [Ancylostoma duodenale]|uniref:DNA primase large subunit n=1 Tax=Ancylostoma duodenale TaxID=51022 RepID=A0A0C2D9B0_9BILA|nr:Eukaryotic-type DNA primase, large subunit [Ancylostoma duodenale]